MKLSVTVLLLVLASASVALGQSLSGLPVYADGAKWYVYGGPDDIPKLRLSTTEDLLATWAAAAMVATAHDARYHGWPELVIAAEPSTLASNATFAHYAAGFVDAVGSAESMSHHYGMYVSPILRVLQHAGGAEATANLTQLLDSWAATQRADFTRQYPLNVSALSPVERAAAFESAYVAGQRDGYHQVYAQNTHLGVRELTDGELLALSIASDELPVLAASLLSSPCDSTNPVAAVNVTIATAAARCVPVAEARTELLAFARRQGLAMVSSELNATGSNVVANYTTLFPGVLWKVLQLESNIAGPATPGAAGPNLGHATAASLTATVTALHVPTYVDVLTAAMGRLPSLAQVNASLTSSGVRPFVNRLFTFLLASALPGPSSATAPPALGTASVLSATTVLTVRSNVTAAQRGGANVEVHSLDETLGTGGAANVTALAYRRSDGDGRTWVLDGQPGGPVDSTSITPPAEATITTVPQMRSAWRAALAAAVSAVAAGDAGRAPDQTEDGTTIPTTGIEGARRALLLALRNVSSDAATAAAPERDSVALAAGARFELVPSAGVSPTPSPWYFVNASSATANATDPASIHHADALLWVMPSLRGVVCSVAAPVSQLVASWGDRSAMPVYLLYGPPTNKTAAAPVASLSSWEALLPQEYARAFSSAAGWMPTAAAFDHALYAFVLPLTPASAYHVSAFEFGAAWVVIVVAAIAGPSIFILCGFAMRRSAAAERSSFPDRSESSDGLSQPLQSPKAAAGTAAHEAEQDRRAVSSASLGVQGYGATDSDAEQSTAVQPTPQPGAAVARRRRPHGGNNVS